MPRKVIIEVQHSQTLANLAATGASVSDISHEMAPIPAGVRVDPTFPPVPVPGRTTNQTAFDMASFDPKNVSEPYDLDDRPEATSFILRGEVDDDVVEAVESPAVVPGAKIYADVAIGVCQVCPGSPPLGNGDDVARLLGVEQLQAHGMDGTGVYVAIVDTGVNLEYLASQGKHPRFDAARSWSPAGGGTPGQQPVGHGTMCAFDACIAAPNCTLLDIAVLQSTTPGSTAMEGLLSDAVLAYSHLLRVMRAPQRPGETRSIVVSNSWGMFHPSWDFPVGHPGNYSDNANHPFNRIVGALERAGADILFAAGNCGRDCPDGRCEGVVDRPIYGANSHPQVLCVGGVDVTGDRAGYSSLGPGRLMRQKPDICGFTHFSGSGVYAADGGTSAATPVVTGLVAALRTRVPSITALSSTSPAAVRNLLRKTAVDHGTPGFDYEYGWGIVNGHRISQVAMPSFASNAAGIEKLRRELASSAERAENRVQLKVSDRLPGDSAPRSVPQLEADEYASLEDYQLSR